MGSPNRRAWTLAGLDRAATYLLTFDRDARRWDVQLVEEPEQGAPGRSASAARTARTHLAPAVADWRPPA